MLRALTLATLSLCLCTLPGCQGGSLGQNLADTAHSVQVAAGEVSADPTASAETKAKADKVGSIAGMVADIATDPAGALGGLIANHGTAANLGIWAVLVRVLAPTLIGLVTKIGAIGKKAEAPKP